MTTQRQNESVSDVTIIPSTCPHDCGANHNCLLKLHVRNGVIIRIETDDGEEPQLRACARGHSQRQRVYSPDRLKYPMKRVGERGEGKFERISWDEALDKIASEMKRIKAQYGPGAFVNAQYAGEFGLQWPAVGRLMNMFGGSLSWWGGASLEGHYYAAQATYGSRGAARGFPDPTNSRLIIMWAWNPANNHFKVNSSLYMSQIKERGARFVCVDPRYTMSAALYADEWIPLIPGTDAAMLIAMAYVMITENLHSQKFLDTYTVGFDKYKEYVLGKEDGIAKTPAWAEAITGVPAATIARLAREYATTKPATLLLGLGPARTAYGEQFSRAAHVLLAMTGNIGTPGSETDLITADIGDVPTRRAFGKGRNPFDYDPDASPPAIEGSEDRYQSVDVSQSSRMGSSLDPDFKSRRRILQAKLYDAILEGKAGGYPSDIKMVWVNCANTLNQLPNTNKGVRAFKKLEFIVVSEQLMTPTAKFADILLPVKSHFERDNIYGRGALFYCKQAISPMFECRSDFEICCDLAKRLGIENYSDKTEEEWWRWQMGGEETKKHIPDFEAFKKKGFYKPPPSERAWSFRRQIEEPRNNPFPTPSGKIEIYSQTIADLHNPEIPPIPKYMETWESRNDPLAKKYPLQLITTHFKLRAHSNFGNVPWLTQLEPQRVTINTADAEARGICDGEEVRIFNDRGEIIIPAFVTETIMPGVVCISEGAWYNPDKDGIDRGGCPNVLTKSEHSPGGAWTTHTGLVQVAKARK